MEFKRTPDECFGSLEDYPFEPNYLSVDDTEGGQLRIHYLDEGPADGDVVLLMHGQPTWSYLYRHMIPPLVEAGFRVIAPDLVGFDRSDKPTQVEDYTYARHVAWMSEWLNALDLKDITVFFQDWGSLIGLRLVAAFPERFARVVLANGGMPTGMIPEQYTQPLKEAYKSLPVVPVGELGERFQDTSGIPGFLYWRKFCAESPDLEIGQLMSSVSALPLSADAEAAYRAPFPDQGYMAGARRFPGLVPVFHDEPEVEENKAAWEVLRKFDRPFMLAFADNDPVTAGGDKKFLQEVPGCKGVAHRTIEKAGHFLQQDQPGQCVQAILDITGLALPDRMRLIGGTGSPYTQKMVALMRYRHIPYSITWGDPGGTLDAMGIEKPKLAFMPTFLFDNAQGGIEAACDSTPIIRRLEARYPGRSVLPGDPALAFIDYLIEDFADEWATKYMFHYRWYPEADADNAGTGCEAMLLA